jgi:hypothetical protein
MLNNLFNKKNCKNITSKINVLGDFKDYVLKSKDEDKYYYITIDDLKFKIGLVLNYIFEKLEIYNLYMIIIYKGSLSLIKKYHILDFNVKIFEEVINDLNNIKIKI